MKKKYSVLIAVVFFFGAILLVAGAFLIYSFKDTRLRYTIDGLVVDSPKWELRVAVASGDSGNIRRTFSKATWRPVWKMSEAVPTMQNYLANTNPLVRYYAAKALYTFGDQGGYSTLLATVQTPGSVIDNGQDLRIQAATTLAQYRQTNAARAC